MRAHLPPPAGPPRVARAKRAKPSASGTAALALLVAPRREPAILPLPAPNALADVLLPPNHHRLLPAKPALRALAALTQEGPVEIDSFLASAGEAAAAVGDLLRRREAAQDLGATARLSIGFPSDEGLPRFREALVAARRGDGWLDGLLPRLRLAAVAPGEDGALRVALTQEGWEFARMPSPVLDGDATPWTPFFPAEREFLVRHVARAMPEEASRCAAVLRAARDAGGAPEALDAALSEWCARRGSPAAAPALSAARSALCGRLGELRLLDRAKQGTNVRFVPTEDGTRALAAFESAAAPRGRFDVRIFHRAFPREIAGALGG